MGRGAGASAGAVFELLQADLAEICFIPNTTTGINLVAEGWPWQPGDNVVIPEGEFPSNLFPWQNQAVARRRARIVPSGWGGACGRPVAGSTGRHV